MRRSRSYSLISAVLPRDHWLSGRDWRNRERRRALDRTLARSGRHEWVLFDMLERLEGHQTVEPGGLRCARRPAGGTNNEQGGATVHFTLPVATEDEP
jgi:hypothetical protein